MDDVLGEDYARLGGLSAEEDLQEPVRKSVRKRLPWLIILLGLMNGAILGILSFLLVGLYLACFKGQNILMAFSVSACTGFALLVSMCLSSLSGTVVPMLFQKLNVDPAVASGPLITTVNDLAAVVTYYGTAWILLMGVMGF